MRMAVAAETESLYSFVAEDYESSRFLLIIETEGNVLLETVPGGNPQAYLESMLRNECEAVICGPHLRRECFDPIADANITRYQGNGWPVPVALQMAVEDKLPLIRGYDGGQGCTHYI